MHDHTTPSCGVSLRSLLPEAAIFGADDITVRSCSSDSRSVQPGDIFVAQVGANCDGHDYVDEAVYRGASAILAERYLTTGGLPLGVVPNTHVAFGKLCHALAGNPSQRVKVIGVTGTHGKTTTAELIAGVLCAAGNRVAVLSTLGSFDGEQFDRLPAANPSTPAIVDWLLRAEKNGCTHAVLEVSSQTLCQARIAGIELDLACVTNVRRNHLDFHNTVHNYRATKSRLFGYLRPGAAAVLNLDDAVCHEYLRSLEGPALSVGLVNNADVTAVVVERFTSEQTFLLSAGSDTATVRTRMIGDHHVYHCLTAAAVGLLYDIPLATIVRGLEKVDQVPGRLERIECGQAFSVYVDSARTSDAVSGSLEAVREVTEGRVICVFGCEGDADRESRPFIGQAVEALSDLAVITDDNPRSEEPARIVSDIIRGFDSLENVIVMHDRAKAICWALGQAAAGDSVVIVGKGEEEFQQLGSQKFWFDDREVARHWLYGQANLTGFNAQRRAA